MTRGVPVGKRRLHKLMELHGICVSGKRRFKVTTDSHHQLPISPGWLDREFTVAEPDKVWVGDTLPPPLMKAGLTRAGRCGTT